MIASPIRRSTSPSATFASMIASLIHDCLPHQVIDLSECYIRIELDQKRIRSLHLAVDAYGVRYALLSQPKLKLNPNDLIVETSAVLKVRLMTPDDG